MLTRKPPEGLIYDTLDGVPAGAVDAETGEPLTYEQIWKLMGYDVKWSDSIVPRAYVIDCSACGFHVGSSVNMKNVMSLLNAHSYQCEFEHWQGMDP